jgi:hypothetical protein
MIIEFKKTIGNIIRKEKKWMIMDYNKDKNR